MFCPKSTQPIIIIIVLLIRDACGTNKPDPPEFVVTFIFLFYRYRYRRYMAKKVWTPVIWIYLSDATTGVVGRLWTSIFSWNGNDSFRSIIGGTTKTKTTTATTMTTTATRQPGNRCHINNHKDYYYYYYHYHSNNLVGFNVTPQHFSCKYYYY